MDDVIYEQPPIHANGLKIHIKRKHANDSETCDLCDEKFESVREMKMHKTTHSYDSKTEKHHECVECDFTSTTIETMEVHIGKCCYNYFECGLCEDRFKNLEMLELHLKTCEVYECGQCYIRYKSLSEVKKHVEKEHEDEKSLHHLKMDRSRIEYVYLVIKTKLFSSIRGRSYIAWYTLGGGGI